METKPCSWWQKEKKLVIVGFIVLLVVIVLIYAGYQFSWTGFPNKTLWDWFQLLGVLAVPVAVGFGKVWFTQAQQHRDQQLAQLQHDRDQQLADQRAKSEKEAAEKRAETEREIAIDNQHEAALQGYVDKLSELLLKEHLSESKPEYEEVRNIARVRTLTVLPRLDAIRKRSIIEFLFASRLFSWECQFR